MHFPQDSNHHVKSSWQEYQKQLKRAAAKKRMRTMAPKYGCAFLVLLVTIYGIAGGFAETRNGGGAHNKMTAADHPIPPGPLELDSGSLGDGRTTKDAIRSLVPDNALFNLRDRTFDIRAGKQRLRVETSLDLSLQHFLLGKFDKRTAEEVGIVVMDPSDGRILAMASFDKSDPDSNLCTDALFPAASVFKIVTAAAGIEINHYNTDSPFTYNGRKHTLYKSQLKNRRNRYTNQITFRDSFAQSVNPVFGKMGASLGREAMVKYAEAFGFNHIIDFEIPVVTSTVSLSDDPYQWAEIASGFNRQTTMSPIHGATMAATVLNRGISVTPTIITQILDEAGEPVYHSRTGPGARTISSETSLVLSDLMLETVRSGTCRKTFSDSRKHNVLSRLRIGGKTGSINSSTQDKRYDWFVGFASAENGSGSLVLSVVVAHGKYVGIRASRYARWAIEHYFGNYFAKNTAMGDKADG